MELEYRLLDPCRQAGKKRLVHDVDVRFLNPTRVA